MSRKNAIKAMKTKLTIVAVAAVLAATALPMLAHHAFTAEFDASRPLSLSGTFTKMDWVNPHSWIYVDVVNADGEITEWAFETPPPNILYRQGWRRDSIEVGQRVEVRAFAAFSGRPRAWASRVTRVEDGQVMLSMRSPAPERE